MSLIVLMLASCTTEQPRPLGEPYSPEKSACYPLVKIKEAASCCTEVGATHVGWKTAEIGGSYRVPICR